MVEDLVKSITKKALKLGLSFTSAYLAINLNFILVLHILPVWVPSSRYAITEPLWWLYDLVNFWDTTFCLWGDSFLNLTFAESETVQGFSFWLTDVLSLRWGQLVLLYEASFTSSYGGLFYFIIGSLTGLLLTGIDQLRNMGE